MEVNVEIVLSYNDEETDWKVKKIISRFLYRLKKYRTGNRFSGEYTYKINQDSEVYKQIIEFYKSNKEDVEFICLNYGVKITDEEFENQCEKCERINMTENENIFYFIPKRITEEGINNLKDVNKTYEFYDEYRENYNK